MNIVKSSVIAQIYRTAQLFLALFVTENYLGVASKSQIFYVVASNGSQCPPEITTSQCHTLDWYTQNKNVSFKSNTMMIFLEGKHSLDSFIEVSSCSNFTMAANKSVVPDHYLLQPASWIVCKRESTSGFFFMNSTNIHITGLGLDMCSGIAALSSTLNAYVALAFSHVNSIALSQVVVNNTKGFGLYCSSVFGQINVKQSVFVNAKGTNDSKICGGNALFWFGSPCYNGNTNVIIDHCWFMYGKNTHNKFCNASGLQIVIGCPKINTTMNGISVIGNEGNNGGNLVLSLTDYGPDTGKITISNCNISDGWATKGGGIKFWHCIDFIGSGDMLKSISILNISNSSFSNNIVNTSAGGAAHITLYDTNNHFSIQSRHIHITDSIFIGNKGALEIMKLSMPGYKSFQFTVYFNMCMFQSNQVPSDKVTSIMELIGVENVTLDDCIFTDNYGSAIYLQNSYLHFFGTITFESNHAAYGGALHVRDGSLIYLHKLSNILFMNNSAHMGGAVYFQDGCVDILPPCLFQQVSSELINIYDQTVVRFVNNSARQAGDAIYGGSIDHCFSLSTLSKTCDGIYARPLNTTLNIIDVSEQSGSSIISSHPHQVCFCDKDIMCNQFVSNFSTFPGGKVNATVAIIGQLNGTTVGEITTFIVDADPMYNSVTKVKNHKEQNFTGQCLSLAYKVFSNETAVKLNFSAVLPIGMLKTCSDPINASMVVTLQPCPFGFALTDTPPYFCDCSPLFHELYAQCDIDIQLIQIYIYGSVWFGCDKQHVNNTIICYLSKARDCYLYCQKDHYVNITSSTIYDDQQCIPGRTGILCGACKPGLSQVLGSSTKCQECSNRNLFFLIPLIFLSGWIIIIFLSSLNMTVAEGTINGLILYGNAMYAYQKLIPNPSVNVFKKICWTFIALLNFDVGTETCFYDGMDSYYKLWIFYGYTFYLIMLQIIIVLLCRRFITCTRLFRKNVLQVLATLLVVMYAPIVDAITHTFARTTLKVYNMTKLNTEPKKSNVWIFDGNITYLGAKHSILFVVGLVYFIAVTFFTFSLLLNQCLQRRSHHFCFRWVERWRPFFEAYTGPCNDNFRFWPGFLIFMRIVLIVSVNNGSSSVVSTNITVFSVIIMSLSCIFPHGIYKKWSLNVLEFSFFLNLCITSIIWTAKKAYRELLFYLSACNAMLIFLGIIIYHIIVRVKIRQPICERILCLSEKIPCKHQILICCHCYNNESEENDETATLLPQPLVPCVQREPLQ